MTRELAVLLYGRQVATVTQDAHGRHHLTYEPGYSGPDATPVSTSMPTVLEVHVGKPVDAYMAGLLPDGLDVRERWADRWGVSATNSFALLEHMGLDCAGAVQFVPPDGVEQALTRPKRLTAVSQEDIASRLAALRTDDTSWVVSGERWSLAGAQGKFTLTRSREGHWSEPEGASPSTHIVKPGISGYRDQALNEHLCLRAAAACGLEAVATEYTAFAGQPALVIARYDRRRSGDLVVRLHQEDMCQALSVFPRRKDEASGGPGVARIAELLRDRSTRPDRDVRAFLTAVAFNYLIGAPDAHAKNYSVLLAGSQVRLAPLYDVASGLPYEATGADAEMVRSAMSIGGHRIFGDVAGRHWDRMARLARFSPRQMREIVADLAERIPSALEQGVSAQSHADDELGVRLIERVGALCATTLEQLRH
ncbi:type II toxin-antitoxin system HipA family toxin [Isoptericola sp. 178]|uniref:type II toxin-antitoxin system HipA family toxin n=1 Tax=Isoptericola sp. 178 TaxID=3064651 RepID=UPI002712DCF6|nr:type II toxin-antitoxin system HipA family toxin [Isoptericola sp. 178]MDO8143788.1 type II toxin-antitoxin system HipA family toxin [Isoptericola sp. 178]